MLFFFTKIAYTNRMIDSNILEIYGLKKLFCQKLKFLQNKNQCIEGLRHIDFVVKKGETLGITGESGGGKSTLLRCIAQLIKPTQGKILFKGVDLITLSDKKLLPFRKDIQMIFQDPYAALDPHMTAFDIICEPLKILKQHKLLNYI